MEREKAIIRQGKKVIDSLLGFTKDDIEPLFEEYVLPIYVFSARKPFVESKWKIVDRVTEEEYSVDCAEKRLEELNITSKMEKYDSLIKITNRFKELLLEQDKIVDELWKRTKVLSSPPNTQKIIYGVDVERETIVDTLNNVLTFLETNNINLHQFRNYLGDTISK